MTTAPNALASPHTMTRLDIATGRPFEEFRTDFEAAVPTFDLARATEIVESDGTWTDIEQAAVENAPHDFMLYATIDTGPVMALAGHTAPAVEYLMGNHVIAERMYRHHPAALLYAPLRILLHGDADGRAVFTLDQPSTVFARLDNADIATVGIELDRKLASLLRHLHAPVPAQLVED